MSKSKVSTKEVFKSNETLELCDVHVSQNGAIEVETKAFNHEAMDRLGIPEKVCRGRIKVVNRNLYFTPYAEASSKPTFTARATVGSTTLAVTEDKTKLSLVMPRHMGQEQLIMFIEEETKEVVRRLRTDLYTSLIIGGIDQKGGAA